MLKHSPPGSRPALTSTRANILWATAVQVIEKLAGYAVIAVLTRTLLKAELGTMFFALTLAELCATLVNFGTDSYLMRAVAVERSEALRHLSEVLSVRLQNSLAGFAALNLAVYFLQPSLSPVLVLVSAYDLLEEIYYCFSAFFAGQRQLIYRLLTAGVLRAVSVVILSVTAIATRSLLPVLWAHLFVSALLAAAALWIVRRRFGPVRLRFAPRAGLDLMRLSAPFFLINFLTLLHMRLDTVMVALFLNLSQVANYELGIKMMEVARFAIRPLNAVFYPILSEYTARGQWRKLRRRFWQLTALAVGGGIALAVGMQLFGSVVVVWLFGDNYVDSVAPARILFLAVPLMYFNFLATIMANAMRLERWSALWLFGCVVLNVGLNFFAIPVLGIAGAAWTTVVSQSFLALAMLGLVARGLRRARLAALDPAAAPGAFSPPDLS